MNNHFVKTRVVVLGIDAATFTLLRPWMEEGKLPNFKKICDSGVTGPLTNFFNSIAGNPIVDWLFMIGLLGIGIGLITGITMKLASYGGTVMVLLMWLASLPTAHGVFMDEHVIYALVLLILVWTKTEDKIWSLSKWWKELRLVKKHKWLE